MLVTDVLLGMNGIDLAVQVRRISRLQSDSVLGQAATSDLLATANRQGHQFDLLSKPLHPRDLLARVSLRITPGHLSTASAD